MNNNILQFKTSLNCQSCVKTVTEDLNNNEKITRWEVDLNNPLKVLTIVGEASAEDIAELFENNGHEAELISSQ